MGSEVKQTVMYSQLQPWSQAGAPPCLEQVSGPPIPARVGTFYQVFVTVIGYISLIIYDLFEFHFRPPDRIHGVRPWASR